MPESPPLDQRVDVLEQRADLLTHDVEALRAAVRMLIADAAREGRPIDARIVALVVAADGEPQIPLPYAAERVPTGRRVRGAALPDRVRAAIARRRKRAAELEASGDLAGAAEQRAVAARLEAEGRAGSGPSTAGASASTVTNAERDAYRDADRHVTRHDNRHERHDSRHETAPSRGPKDSSLLVPREGNPLDLAGSSQLRDQVVEDRSLEHPLTSSPDHHVSSTPRARSAPTRARASAATPPAPAADAAPPDDEPAPSGPSAAPSAPSDTARLWKAVDRCADAWRAAKGLPPSWARQTKSTRGHRMRIYDGCVRADSVFAAAGVPVVLSGQPGGPRYPRTEAIAAAFHAFSAARVEWRRWSDEASEWARAVLAQHGTTGLRRGSATFDRPASADAPTGRPAAADAAPPASSPTSSRRTFAAPRPSLPTART